MVCRSWIFMPGHKEKMINKTYTTGADAVVWDIEDGVPNADKPAAREMIKAKLAERKSLPSYEDRTQVYVRINCVPKGMLDDDLNACIWPNVDGIMMPMVESPDEVRTVHRAVSTLEEQRGMAPGSVKILVTFETALGVLRALEIAQASDRVMGLCFGAEDFTLDVGTSRSREGSELMCGRALTLLAAAARKIQVVDTVFSDLSDEEGLSNECKKIRQLGFTGKCAIHPKQIPIINRDYSPSEKEMEYARKVVEAYEEAAKQGIGVITVNGKMIDPPVVDRCRNLIKRFNG